MKFFFAIGAAATLFGAAAAHAEDGDNGKAKDGKPTFSIKPTLFDSDNTDEVALGLEYALDGKLNLLDLSGKDNGPGIDPDVTVGHVILGYKATGAVATSADRNPKDFLDFRADLSGLYSLSGGGTATFGAFVKYETDQSFDKEQTVFGGHLAWGKAGLLQKHDFLAIDTGYGRVAPGDDTDRKAALGVTTLDDYDRFEFELLYSLPIKTSIIREIELNYRLYREIKAPAAIKAAGLRTHQLGTVRVGLPNNLFVAYSVGKLPFDRKNDQIVQIGLSYKLF